MRKVILCDVDGVVADLMGGFSRWLDYTTVRHGHPSLDPSLITKFDIRAAAREPALVELDDLLRGIWSAEGEDGGINGAFMAFMHGEAYEWVSPIPGALEGIRELRLDYEVHFCTALMEAAPEHIPSKMRWLKRYFPGVPYFTAPSKLKMRIRGDIGIDDRYDTCMRWEEIGTRPLLFRQSWNEAPEGCPRYDWTDLTKAVRG